MKRIADKNLPKRLDEISVLKKVKDKTSQPYEDDPTQTLMRDIHYELLLEPRPNRPIILVVEQRTSANKSFKQFLFWYTEEEYRLVLTKMYRPKLLKFEKILEIASPKVQSELLFHLDIFG